MGKVYDMIGALNGTNDHRTKRYIPPKRVVYTQGSVGDSQYLLEDCPNQLVFHPQKGIWMENKPGQPKAAFLVDFGVEISGFLRLLVRGVRAVNAIHTRSIPSLAILNGQEAHFPPSGDLSRSARSRQTRELSFRYARPAKNRKSENNS
jgi:hypothetical protein